MHVAVQVDVAKARSMSPGMTRRGSTQELRHASSSEGDQAVLLHADTMGSITEGVFRHATSSSLVPLDA